jgi:hypothetical protein
MPIVRSQHKKDFTRISITTLRDKQLSLPARGLLTYMLSFKDDWEFKPELLIRELPCGRNAIYRLFKELENQGYLVRDQTRRSSGKLDRAVYTVYERPQPLLTVYPTEAVSGPAKPDTENGAPVFGTIKKDCIKNDCFKERLYTNTNTSTERNAKDLEKGKEMTEDERLEAARQAVEAKYGRLPDWAKRKPKQEA